MMQSFVYNKVENLLFQPPEFLKSKNYKIKQQQQVKYDDSLSVHKEVI